MPPSKSKPKKNATPKLPVKQAKKAVLETNKAVKNIRGAAKATGKLIDVFRSKPKKAAPKKSAPKKASKKQPTPKQPKPSKDKFGQSTVTFRELNSRQRSTLAGYLYDLSEKQDNGKLPGLKRGEQFSFYVGEHRSHGLFESIEQLRSYLNKYDDFVRYQNSRDERAHAFLDAIRVAKVKGGIREHNKQQRSTAQVYKEKKVGMIQKLKEVASREVKGKKPYKIRELDRVEATLAAFKERDKLRVKSSKLEKQLKKQTSEIAKLQQQMQQLLSASKPKLKKASAKKAAAKKAPAKKGGKRGK